MAIVATASKKKSPPARRCVPGLSICLLISQPLFEDCSILCFYLHKRDAHSFCRDIMGHSAEGRELVSSMVNAHTYSGSLGKWCRGLNEAAASAQIAGNYNLLLP